LVPLDSEQVFQVSKIKNVFLKRRIGEIVRQTDMKNEKQ
jgi:hypothetical protein